MSDELTPAEEQRIIDSVLKDDRRRQYGEFLAGVLNTDNERQEQAGRDLFSMIERAHRAKGQGE
jgi:hypothetical protein